MSDEINSLTTQQQRYEWACLILDIRLCVTSNHDEAIAIASALRDCYPNLSLVQVSSAIRAGRLYRDAEFFFLAESAHHARSTVALLDRMRTSTDKLTAIGNTNCKYNAQSKYLRCAVKPNGSCEDCQFFEERDRDE